MPKKLYTVKDERETGAQSTPTGNLIRLRYRGLGDFNFEKYQEYYHFNKLFAQEMQQ